MRRGKRCLRACAAGVLLLTLPLAAAGRGGRAAAVTGPTLAVDAAADRHAISPDIYGLNFAYEKRIFEDTAAQLAADQAFAGEIRVPLDRWGGDSTVRYNWQTGVSNHAVNFYFENIPQAPDHNGFIALDRVNNSRTLLTVNTMGLVAKPDSATTRPYDCSFKIAKYGPQQDSDPYDSPRVCGNGRHTDGSLITGNDPADTSVAVAPSFIASWVADLVRRYGTAAAGGVRDYALDNEPDLWYSTHRDVHPANLGYDELRDKDTAVAAAVKGADPSARVVGPAFSGYTALFDVVFDGSGPSADKLAHGGQDVAPWFLGQMKAYDDAPGHGRLLDLFDVHYYPQATGLFPGGSGESAATQALRLRAVRSLWDPTYVDESYIGSVFTDERTRVRLIRRMHDMVDASYPGTGIAIGEYNFGAVNTLNGALAQADVLGVFARERVDQAEMWAAPHAADPAAYAFRMYRNYDGRGGSFGDTWVRSTSTDQGQLAVYGAQRGSDGALTLMVINKTGSDLTSPLTVANAASTGSAQVYRYSGANLGAIQHLADQPMSGSTLTTTYPANSITLLVLPATPSTTVSASPSTVSAGAAITAAWANVAAPTPRDWMGLYASASATDSAFVAWRYTGGAPSGSTPLTIPAGTAAGTAYELRLFANDGYTRLARSGPIVVTAASLSASPGSVAAGAATTVAWAGIAPPSATDWVGLYASPSAPDSSFVAWQYAGGTAAGSAPFTVPAGAAAGTTYELRLFSDNGYGRLARAGPITVTTALAANPASVAAGAATMVSWSGVASPSARDWIGLYRSPSDPNSAFVAWRYTGGGASGSAPLTIPTGTAAGTNYELRLLSNDGYGLLARRGPIAVTAASLSANSMTVARGGSATLSWSGVGGATTTDWIGLYTSPSAGDTAFATWVYTGGGASGSAMLTVPADTAPGATYEFRLFANNGYSRLAKSGSVTIT